MATAIFSDYFTKYAWAKALPTKEAVGVVAAMREVGLVYCDCVTM